MASNQVVEITIDDDDECLDNDIPPLLSNKTINTSFILNDIPRSDLIMPISPPSFSDFSDPLKASESPRFSVEYNHTKSGEKNLSDHEFELNNTSPNSPPDKTTGDPFTDNLILSATNPFDILENSLKNNCNDEVETVPLKVPALKNRVRAQPSNNRKQQRSYWSGQEHTKILSTEQPFVLLDKLSLDMLKEKFPELKEDKGHNCKRDCKPKPRKRPKPPAVVNSLPPQPANPTASSIEGSFNLTNTIDAVARSGCTSNKQVKEPTIYPSLGDIVSFRIRTCNENVVMTSNGFNVSSVKQGTVVNIYSESSLYEVSLTQSDVLNREYKF